MVTTRLKMRSGDREELEGWLRSTTVRKGRSDRAKIVLLCAEGLSGNEVACQLGVSSMCVGRWRRRYAEEGIDGLEDRPRPGQPRKLTAAKGKEILRLTTEPRALLNFLNGRWSCVSRA